MSCTSCGSVNSNCSCSDNCPNKASDITVFDCNNLNVIEVPCDASLCDILGLLESYTTNMVGELSNMTSVVISAESCIGLSPGTYSLQQITDALDSYVCDIPVIEIESGDGINIDSNVVGGVTTYTISGFGAMRAQSPPVDVPTTAPSTSVSLYINGTTQIMSEIYDDDNAYNPSTGIWTCPATGLYNLSFFVHLTNEISGFSNGMIIAGITSATSNIFYCVSSATFNQTNKHADVTGTALGVTINAGAQLVLKVLNTSDINYVTIPTDGAIMSIQRVR